MLITIISLFFLCSSNINSMEQTVDTILKRTKIKKANIGIEIYDVEKNKTVYSLNGDKVFSMASVTKLLTTASAIKLLGHDFRFKTKVYKNMNSDIYIKGGGDPVFVSENMWFLVNRLCSLGIKEIKGNIILDDSMFASEGIYGANSDRAYSAKVSSLPINFNSIAVNVVSGENIFIGLDPPVDIYKLIDKTKHSNLTTNVELNRVGNNIYVSGNINTNNYSNKIIYRNIDDPFKYFVEVLKMHLGWRDIKFKGQILKARTPESNVTQLFEIESRRFTEVLMEMNKYSSNFIADQTIRAIACELAEPKCDVGSALELIKVELQKLGLQGADYNIVNGSGLSYENKAKPASLVKFLANVYKDFELAPEFLNSLSIGGIDGTVRSGFKDEKMKGKVRAKTGTMTGIRSLAGYFNKNNRTYAFVIVANDNNAHKLLDYESKILQNIR